MPSRRFILSLFAGLLFASQAWAQGGAEVEEMLTRASKLVSGGSIDAGTKVYKEVLALRPDNVDALFSLVQISDAVQDFYGVVFYGKAYLAVAFDDVDRPDIERKIDRARDRLQYPGRLKIQIYPEDAEVQVNGLMLGKGTLELPLKPQDNYIIESSYKDHVPFKVEVNLRQSEEKLITKRLEKITFFGELQLKLVPPQTGVEVFVDTAPAGTDVTSQRLSEGKHLVCLRKPGFDRWWRYVEVPRNDKFMLEAQLFESPDAPKPCDVMPGPEFE
jgi:hypothetical protein